VLGHCFCFVRNPRQRARRNSEIFHRFMRPASTVSHCMPLWLPRLDPLCFGLPQVFLFRAFALHSRLGYLASGMRTGQPRGTILSLCRVLGGIPNGAQHSVTRPTVFGTAMLVLRCVMLHLTTGWSATRTATAPNQLLMRHTLT
jgi:hypothetical protein